MAFFFIDSNLLNIAPKSVPNELGMQQPPSKNFVVKLIRLEKIRLNLGKIEKKFD